jgi:HD-like signal output (HDOD) protein
MWGVTEIPVIGSAGKKAHPRQKAEPEIEDKLAAQIRPLFRYNVLEHPAVREMFRLAVNSRIERGLTDTATPETEGLQAVDSAQSPEALKHIMTMEDLKLPEMPSIVFKLNEEINNPLASAENIARVVNKSPGLTALLLKIVNSPFYGFPSRIDKVSRAVTLIGTREISNLALGISVIALFTNIPRQLVSMHSFLRHSLSCGIMARIIAAHKKLPQTEQMFVAGLLHDIGRLILYRYLPHESRAILAKARNEKQILYQVEARELEWDHTDIGSCLLKQWKLPFILENNVSCHHEPLKAQNCTQATILHLADCMSNALGLGTSGECLVPQLDTTAWDYLGLPATLLGVVARQTLHQLNFLEPWIHEHSNA